ncbi:hypothetical protein DFP72DRAFT_1165848 [Ephemerocybe angulata]|uniref:Uncharacterized protein n=1 Tax=Ephemerocybe angulata TaxID=980116 RepID=A0A8H6M9B2_9AGAR|nr:hypothetical protein DFP72DRAFT_1165848 [Tulosesus angulatus]
MSIRDLEDRPAVQDGVEALESRSTQEEEGEEEEGEEEEGQGDEEEEIPEGEVLITRDTFIENLEYAGATLAERMVITDENGENQYPSRSVQYPEEWDCARWVCYLIMDPLVLVASLRKSGVKYESQLPAELLQNLKDTIMSANNMCIVPISIWEGKLEAIGHSVAMGEKEGEEEEGEAGENEP